MDWIDVLTMHSVIDDNKVTLTEDVGRDGWTSIKDAMERINGQWDKKAAAFIFPFDPRPVIDMILDSGVLPKRNKFAYFPTPRILIETMAKATDLNYAISRAKRLCEPSAGTGWMADYMREYMAEDAELICCEIDEPNVAVLRHKGHNVVDGDFLLFNPEEKFDVILMNPPFQGTTFAKHMRHAQSLLTPNGRVFAIMPEPWFSRTNLAPNLHDLRNDILISNETLTHEIFENAFEGTSIPTMAGELLSVEALAKKVKDPRFILESVDDFVLSMTNDWTYAEQFQKIQTRFIIDRDYERACKSIKDHIAATIPKFAAKSMVSLQSLHERYFEAILLHLEDIRQEMDESGDFCEEIVDEVIDTTPENEHNEPSKFLDFFE